MRAGLLLAVALLATPASLAQVPQAGPAVRFPDARVDERVIPLGAPGQVQLEVAIGCAAVEGPQWTTQATIAASGPPTANAIVSPASLAWTSQPGDCPSQGTPYRGNVTLSISLTQNAPAFTEQRIHLILNVTKSPAGQTGQATTYGPYHANVTYTPGYFDLFNTRIDEKIQQVSPGETAAFHIRIDNFSNDETRFAIRATPQGQPDATVRVDPPELVLDPMEAANATILASLEDPGGNVVNDLLSLEATVTANSTTMPGVEGSTSDLAMQVQFRRVSPDPRDAPAPGPGGLVAALAALALARRRRYL